MYASVTPYRLLRVDFLLTALLVAVIVAVFLFALFGGNLAWAAESAPAVGSTVAVTTPTAVAIPYGDVVTQFLAWARDGLVALAALAVTRYAPPLVGQYLTNELLAKAIDFAIARVDGAVKGGQIGVPVANAVLKQAADYVVANAPGRAKALGDMLMPKLLARLSAATVLPATPVVLPPAPPVDGAKAAVLKSHAWLALPLAVLPLCVALGGCPDNSTLAKLDAAVNTGVTIATATVKNPVTPTMVYDLRAAHIAAQRLALAYRRLGVCPLGVSATVAAPCADRAVLTNMIAADRAARKAVDALAAYVKGHPTLDATDLYTAAKAAVTKLQGATPAA